ncbi:hypothetical protein HDF16_002617 [Granulicella aggregans]|uniref:TonB-dependent transporter Oar-like beta-barrel domain-containing protein n=1 Tax=Granulicella aggregans TaxID=474949 RepID=A0A7W7ZEJ9_9BACT|nr:TonB-dependent receptor [Granulicella aggregans]MBB5057911.1 hypothetical protein [Granulicella aggregans]
MKRFAALISPLLLLCLICISGTALGQSISGTLVGLVTDPSGAAVIGAKVTVRDTATNQSFQLTTGKDGEYRAPNLEPSTYEITISAAGFSNATVNSVRLLVNATQRNDVKLVIGSANNTVDISAAPDAITTDSASIGTVIDGQQIARYPLNGRTVDSALLFVAGNTSDSAAAPNIGGATRWGGTYYTVDGVPFNDLGNGSAAYSYDSGLSTLPSTETIQEIKVESSLAKAEFEGGSAVSIITKSGSNRFHGEIYEFNRNRAYAARDFFTKDGVTAKPELNRNEFGGTLGGPIWKDKTFFFGSAEYFFYRAGHPRSFIVPTDAERTGDFSALGKTLYDPATGLPFAGNQLTAIDPRAAAIVAFMPHANLPNAAPGTNNLTEYYPTKYDLQRYTLKFDHNLDKVHTLTLGGTYSFPNQYFSPNGTPAEYGNYANAGYKTQSAFLRDNMVFSAHLLNEIHYAYLSHRSIRLGQNANFDPTSLFPGLYGPFAIGGLPTVGFNGLYDSVGDTGGSGYSPETTQQILDNFTLVHGKHTFKFGGAINFNAIAIKAGTSNANALGNFGFTGRYTSDAQDPGACTANAAACSTGDPFADFLLGDANSTARAIPQIPNYEKYKDVAFFGQDDWNLTSRITLNFGMRWEMQTTPTEAHGDFTNFDFATGQFVIRSDHGALPKDVNPTVLAAYPGTYTTSEAVGWGSSVINTDKKDFGPRFGFAARPLNTDKLVVRGGYGIYYNLIPPYIGEREVSQLNFPFTLNQTYTATSAIAPQLTLANPFPGTGAIAANPTIYAVNRDLKNARVQQWNLTVEQVLPKNFGVRLSYIGNRATQAPWYVYNKNLPSPMRPLGSLQSGRPYQPWGSILTLVSKGFSKTNQLQFEATKRTGHGLYLQTSYTYNQSLDDVPIVGTPQDPYNPTADVGNTDGTRHHNFFLTGTYELPIQFHGFGERAVNGWSISSLTQVRSGSPFTPTFSIPGTVNGQSTVGWYATRANVVPGAGVYSGAHSRDLWFNPAAFTAPAPFTFGTARRNSLIGPNETGVDLSLEKKTKLWESANLLLRFDAFNVLNHPNFSNPSGNISSSAVGTFDSTGNVANRQVQIGGKIVF